MTHNQQFFAAIAALTALFLVIGTITTTYWLIGAGIGAPLGAAVGWCLGKYYFDDHI